jgi:type IV pilus assembly protein PilM
VADVIASRVGIPAERGDPLGQMKISSKAKALGVGRDSTALLTACGLALRSFDEDAKY